MGYEWPPTVTLLDRFVPKVQFSVSDDECWTWLAFCNGSGYGMIRNGKYMALAHRVSWALANGEVPRGKQVLHNCDNPPCVNPKHLYIGTNSDNVRDKVERGRSSFPHPERRGEKHPMAKLTDEQVAQIRQESTGAFGEGKMLAEKYGVCRATISQILSRKSWKHD